MSNSSRPQWSSVLVAVCVFAGLLYLFTDVDQSASESAALKQSNVLLIEATNNEDGAVSNDTESTTNSVEVMSFVEEKAEPESQQEIDPEIISYLDSSDLIGDHDIEDIKPLLQGLDETAMAYLRLEVLRSSVMTRLDALALGQIQQINRDELVSDIDNLLSQGAILGTEAQMLKTYVLAQGN